MTLPVSVPRLLLALGCSAFALTNGEAHAQSAPAAGPCGEGIVSGIVIRNGDVFDRAPDDPRLLRWIYDAANALHVRTTRGFIGKELLFREGDCFDPFLLSESAQLLDQYPFLRAVTITTEADSAGGTVVYVDTKDEWTTQVDLGVTYDAGFNLERVQVTELNLLGNGIRAEFTRVHRREDRFRSAALSSPRLLGRADVAAHFASSPGGLAFGYDLAHPFVAKVGRTSLRQGFRRSTGFFSFAAGSGRDFSHILVPVLNESLELAWGRRFGDPERSVILGFDLVRSEMRLQGMPEFVLGGNFDGSQPSPDLLPGDVTRQLQSRAATRVGIHLGTRRYRDLLIEGLDAVRDVQYVGDGFLAGVSVGRSLGILAADSLEAGDSFGRLHFSFGKPLGSSYVTGGVGAEAGLADGSWRDLLGGIELVGYGRASWLPNQTLFLRVSGASGWRTTVPFQLSLGGRHGVRSLPEDDLPGGRRLLVIVEDRIRLDWPDWGSADLGLTVFGDVGRMWAGDAPFGVDSPWQGSVGMGLRLGFPRGTRNIWRPDIVFPIGRGGSPVFRITFELNRVRSGFYTAKIARSTRFNRGPESF